MLGGGATVTHLCQAAIILALQRRRHSTSSSNPAGDDKVPRPTGTLTAINARRFLDVSNSPQPHQELTKTYGPICQALGKMGFEDVNKYAVSPHISDQELMRMLIDAAREVKKNYDLIGQRKTILTETIAIVEQLAEKMR